jgi:hypothetical protein
VSPIIQPTNSRSKATCRDDITPSGVTVKMKAIQPARIFMAAALCLCQPVFAEGIKFDEEKAMAAVEKVVAEHRIYATCMSLDKMGLALVQQNWKEEVTLATEELRKVKPSATFVLRFAGAVDFSNLLNRSRNFGDAMDYCHTNEKQLRMFDTFEFSHLVTAIESAETRPGKTK